MSDRDYENKLNELVVKFFRRKTGLYTGITNKSIYIQKDGLMCPMRYNFFYDKLNRHNDGWRSNQDPQHLKLGWKLANANMRTFKNYQWTVNRWHVPEISFTGIFTDMTTDGECPRFAGDGLCLAKTFAGALSGNIYISNDTKIMLMAYHQDHILHNGHTQKYRVRACYVAAVDTFANFVKWLYEQGYTFAKLYSIDSRLSEHFDRFVPVTIAD